MRESGKKERKANVAVLASVVLILIATSSIFFLFSEDIYGSSPLTKPDAPPSATNQYAPSLVAYDSLNRNLYVVNYLGNSVSVIDGRTNSVVTNVSVGSYPQGIAFDSSNGFIYVSNGNSSYVSVIDGNSNKVTDNITVEGEPSSMAYDPSDNCVYLLTGHVVVINGTSNRVVGNITVGAEASDIAYDSLNERLYVVNYISDNVTVINGNNNTVLGSVQLGPPFNKSNPEGPVSVMADTLNGFVYVVVNTHYVYVINATTDEVVGTISTGSYLQGIACDPSNGYLYVVSESSPGRVSVINGSNNKVIDIITVGNGPVGVAYDGSNGQIYVADQQDNAVTVINGKTDTVAVTVSIAPKVSTTPGWIRNINDIYIYLNIIISTYWIYMVLAAIAILAIAIFVGVLTLRSKKKR
jgi:YVTN family beta-propeller protein